MATITGTNAAETLNGTGNDDIINGLGGNDILQGGSGNDTYIFNIGDGDDEILDGAGNADKISFGSGISVSNLLLSVNSSRDLVISIGSETITVEDHFRFIPFGGGFQNVVEEATFTDGSSISLVENIELNATNENDAISSASLGLIGDVNINGLAGDDNITTASENDTIAGGTGNDTLNGFVGDDTYIWNLGDGNDTIQDQEGTDQIILGPGITQDDVILQQADGQFASGDLQINIGNEVITVSNHFEGSTNSQSIETIVLNNGDIITLTENITLLGTEERDIIRLGFGGFTTSENTILGLDGDDSITAEGATVNAFGGSGNDTISTNDGNDNITGGAGNDTLNGGNGSDRYFWNIGDGNDIINDSSTDINTDRIIFGEGVSINDVSFLLENKPLPSNPNSFFSLDLDISVENETIEVRNQFSTIFEGSEPDASDYDQNIDKIEFANGEIVDLSFEQFDPSLSLTNNGASTQEDTTLSITSNHLNASINGDLLSNNPSQNIFTIMEEPAGGQVLKNDQVLGVENTFTQADIDNNLITYKPIPNFNFDDGFVFSVTNGQSTIENQSFNIDIVPVNDAPVAQDDSFTIEQNQAVTINVLNNDNDVDGDPLSVGILPDPLASEPESSESEVEMPFGDITVNPDNTITFTPGTDITGSVDFLYAVDDGNGGTDIATVAITILPPANIAPIANNDSLSVTQGQSATLNILANDSDTDGDTLTPNITSNPINGFAIVNNDKTVTYTASGSFSGTDSFAYSISDGNGGTDTASVSVTILPPPNIAPTANNDSVTIDQNRNVTLNVLANDSDPDGDTLDVTGILTSSGAIVQSLQTSSGQLTVNANNTIAFTQATNATAPVNFTYIIDDGNGGTDTASVSITIEVPAPAPAPTPAPVPVPTPTPTPPPNTAPNAVADTFNAVQGRAVTFNILANDSDANGDNLNPSINTDPANGSVSVNANKTITYIANASFSGTDSFSYTVTDGNGGFDTATVTVNVAIDPNQVIEGTGGNDTINGTARNDQISGNNGNDRIDGRDGNDILFGDNGNDILFGGAGDDTINGGAGNDSIMGGAGNDNLSGNGGRDTISGEAGRDTINGGGGRDTINGNGGRDTINGGGGRDEINGNGGRDTINGGGGADIINGNGGRDIINGGGGADRINGGGGADIINGGRGRDTLTGGAGPDTFKFDNTARNGVDTITDFTRRDKIDIADVLTNYNAADDAITDFVRITQVGNNSELFVDRNGGANSFAKIAILQNTSGLTNELQLENQGILITD